MLLKPKLHLQQSYLLLSYTVYMAGKTINLLRILAIAGNALFILWVIFNAMDSGWKGTLPQIFSSIILVVLLLFNIFYLLNQPRRDAS